MTNHQNYEPNANSPVSEEYEARKKRLEDAIQLKKPDRVPVAPIAGIFYPTQIKGISNKDNMFNQAETYKAWLEAAVRHNWDTALPPILFQPVKIWEKLQITQMKWPGGQLQDHLPFQWVDAEYVSQAEYSEMLSSPNSFAVKKFWPRIAKSLAPISDMMQVEDDVKDLIDIFGDNGGLIIDCNMGIPDEAKPENIQAMTDAVMKYGIYNPCL